MVSVTTTFQHALSYPLIKPGVFFNGNAESKHQIRPLLLAPSLRYQHKKSMWDWLGGAGAVGNFLLGITVLSSPLLLKHKMPIVQAFKKSGVANEKRIKQLEQLLGSQKNLEDLLKKSLMATLFLFNINNYQTAVNSKQPSLLTQSLLVDLLTIIGLFSTKTILFNLMGLSGILFTIGKRNDIENNLHPESRREWDLLRLGSFREEKSLQAKYQVFAKETRSFLKFIKDDFKEVYTLQPWKDFKKNYKNKREWATSMPNSLAAQIFSLSWLTNTIGLLAKKSWLTVSSGVIMLAGITINRVPIIHRAQRNRTELDGKLTLTGLPLSLLGNLFSPQFLPNLYYLNGMAYTGASLELAGYTLNSKRYKRLVTEIEWLHRLSSLNKNLKAQDVLSEFQGNPETLRLLSRQLGKSRVTYLFNLLKRASLAEKQGVPFARFLSDAELQKTSHTKAHHQNAEMPS